MSYAFESVKSQTVHGVRYDLIIIPETQLLFVSTSSVGDACTPPAPGALIQICDPETGLPMTYSQYLSLKTRTHIPEVLRAS